MKRRGGFTLVEVLMALIVAVILFTVVAQGLSLATQSERRAVRASRALELATAKMAEIESGYLGTTREQEGNFGDGDPEFVWELASTATSYAGVSAVTLVVRWAPFGMADQVTLVRYVR